MVRNRCSERNKNQRFPFWFSRLITRSKKNGKLRPVIDLSELNRLLKIPTFKMETVPVISRAISGNLWATSVEIEDANFHVPMNWDFHKYLAFKLKRKTYVFQFLPFGLSPAPWGFSRIIKPNKRRLHNHLISILDDFIILAKSPTSTLEAAGTVLDLQSLGFKLNWKKSSLTPSPHAEYLGVMWDLETSVLSVPLEMEDTPLYLLMRGLFNATPSKPAPMDLWSLNHLLTYLSSDTFEPENEGYPSTL